MPHTQLSDRSAQSLLTEQRLNPVVIHNYCRCAQHFLEYLAQRGVAVDAATPDHVSAYLAHAIRRFHQRHGHPPAPRWQSIPRTGIHALLRLVRKRWPPEPLAASPGQALYRSVCNEYQEWLHVQRGLVKASIRALMWEGRHFLSCVRKDRSPVGYRDYAILLLLSTYGLRDGEIARLRLEDIDWRAAKLHIRHSKTGVSSQLPLMAEVGEALLNYLRGGRPKTDAREIFIRTRAPYRPLSSLYSEVCGRLEAAGLGRTANAVLMPSDMLALSLCLEHPCPARS